ncbi:MAG: hypothetical protein ATN35_04755 [Epulopiscium sp. Nele67-Bin004]|nr:MAG: hypothetical protein ATN35_04755 [Epulopiscium sp. Nele67-Bin004]
MFDLFEQLEEATKSQQEEAKKEVATRKLENMSAMERATTKSYNGVVVQEKDISEFIVTSAMEIAPHLSPIFLRDKEYNKNLPHTVTLSSGKISFGRGITTQQANENIFDMLHTSLMAIVGGYLEIRMPENIFLDTTMRQLYVYCTRYLYATGVAYTLINSPYALGISENKMPAIANKHSKKYLKDVDYVIANLAMNVDKTDLKQTIANAVQKFEDRGEYFIVPIKYKSSSHDIIIRKKSLQVIFMPDQSFEQQLQVVTDKLENLYEEKEQLQKAVDTKNEQKQNNPKATQAQKDLIEKYLLSKKAWKNVKSNISSDISEVDAKQVHTTLLQSLQNNLDNPNVVVVLDKYNELEPIFFDGTTKSVLNLLKLLMHAVYATTGDDFSGIVDILEPPTNYDSIPLYAIKQVYNQNYDQMSMDLLANKVIDIGVDKVSKSTLRSLVAKFKKSPADFLGNLQNTDKNLAFEYYLSPEYWSLISDVCCPILLDDETYNKLFDDMYKIVSTNMQFRSLNTLFDELCELLNPVTPEEKYVMMVSVIKAYTVSTNLDTSPLNLNTETGTRGNFFVTPDSYDDIPFTALLNMLKEANVQISPIGNIVTQYQNLSANIRLTILANFKADPKKYILDMTQNNETEQGKIEGLESQIDDLTNQLNQLQQQQSDTSDIDEFDANIGNVLSADMTKNEFTTLVEDLQKTAQILQAKGISVDGLSTLLDRTLDSLYNTKPTLYQQISALVRTMKPSNQPTFSRPNKKYLSSGFILPTNSAKSYKNDLEGFSIFLDSSGSMSFDDVKICISLIASMEKQLPRKGEYLEFNSEILPLKVRNGKLVEMPKSTGGTDIRTVINHCKYDTKNNGKMLRIIISDGGFCWNTLIDFANENKREKIVVILTDNDSYFITNRKKEQFLSSGRNRTMIIEAQPSKDKLSTKVWRK